MLGLGLVTKWAETPAGKREMQLKVKQVDFLKQQLRRGVIEETPLRDLVYETANTKEYVIESARRDANGLPVSEGRVLTAETFAEAARGIAEVTENGEVVYRGCFAAGTRVHTDQGLLPIEKVRVGTRVLSQPEQGGEQDYRPVINTVAHLDQQVWAVQVKVEGADTLTTLIATPNHPFWVESPLVDGKHWMATECLEPGFVVQLADGRQAQIYAAGLIRRTQHVNIGFVADDRVGVGMVLSLHDGKIELASTEQSRQLDKLTLGEPYLTPVYNFEVEGFHTYYVGEVGVWVHNTNCPTAAEAVRDALKRADLESNPCFVGDEIVITEEKNLWGFQRKKFEHVEVGDKVLSRCEATGEMAYKRVTKVFTRGDTKIWAVAISCGLANDPALPRETMATLTTAEHPFWVQGKGWTAVSDLQPGDQLLSCFGEYSLLVESIHRDVCEEGVVFQMCALRDSWNRRMVF